MNCSKCGSQNQNGTKYCIFCGTPLQEDATRTVAPRWKVGKLTIIVPIVAVVIIGAVIAGVIIARSGSKGKSGETQWSCFGGNSSRSNFLAAPGMTYDRMAWKAEMSGRTRCSAVASGGNVYVCAGDHLKCFDAKSGKGRWDFSDENSVGSYGNFDETTPVLANGSVYVTGGHNDSLYRVDTGSGKMIWETNKGRVYAADGASPIFSDGRIFLDSEERELLCIDAGSGKQLWRFKPSEDEEIVHGSNTTVATSESVYQIARRGDSFEGYGKLYCINAKSGKASWNYEDPNHGFISLSSMGNKIFILTGEKGGAYGSSLICIDASTGKRLWQYPEVQPGGKGSEFVTTACDEQNLYILSVEYPRKTDEESGDYVYSLEGAKYRVECLSTTTGSQLWKTDLEANTSYKFIVVDNSNLYISGVLEDTEKVICLGRSGGSKTWETKVDQYYDADYQQSGLARCGGQLFLTTELYVGDFHDLRLYCIGK